MIFIRLVEGGINTDIRFETAFKDIPNDKWTVFSNANELPQKLYEDVDTVNEDDDIDDTVIPDNANILSMSLLYTILPMLVIMEYI
jgi:hypothetical protein